MAFYVSRQRDNITGRLHVEISCGGSKKAGPDILAIKYGEGKNLANPKDAIAVSERVFRKWEYDYPDETKTIRVIGITPELEFAFDAAGLKKAGEWADKMFASMDKCGACDKPMGNRQALDTEHIPNKVFCSEACIAKKYRDMFGGELPGSGTPKKKVKPLF